MLGNARWNGEMEWRIEHTRESSHGSRRSVALSVFLPRKRGHELSHLYLCRMRVAVYKIFRGVLSGEKKSHKGGRLLPAVRNPG